MTHKETLTTVRIAGHPTRREAMQWVLAAVAVSALPSVSEAAHTPRPTTYPVGGYGVDPNLVDTHKPGTFWPLVMTDAQRKTTKALADVIIPKDQYGPAASEVGAVEMIDEWVSAPYPQQVTDRPVILNGLGWIDLESGRRFSKGFADLTAEQQHAICDEICFAHEAKPPLKQAAHFFSRFRSLCAGAYYSTPPGWDAIGYVGNVPLAKFEGPPRQVLVKLGLI